MFDSLFHKTTIGLLLKNMSGKALRFWTIRKYSCLKLKLGERLVLNFYIFCILTFSTSEFVFYHETYAYFEKFWTCKFIDVINNTNIYLTLVIKRAESHILLFQIMRNDLFCSYQYYNNDKGVELNANYLQVDDVLKASGVESVACHHNKTLSSETTESNNPNLQILDYIQ